MLKTKELSVGNYVYGGLGNYPMVLESIFGTDVYLDFEGNEGDSWECDEKDLQPIWITNEFLLSHGFSQTVDTFELDNDNLHIIIKEDNGYYVHVDDSCFDSVCSGRILYLHQLQNLLMLIGYEL